MSFSHDWRDFWLLKWWRLGYFCLFDLFTSLIDRSESRCCESWSIAQLYKMFAGLADIGFCAGCVQILALRQLQQPSLFLIFPSHLLFICLWGTLLSI